MVKENLETTFSKFYKEFISFRNETRTDIKEIKETLSNHTLALLNIENKNNIYGDMYQANKDSIRRLDTRVANLEKR